MSEQTKKNANYIVANEILLYQGNFTIEDILESVQDKLLNKIFDTIEDIKMFIEHKVSTLCEIGLVSDTGLYFYVN